MEKQALELPLIWRLSLQDRYAPSLSFPAPYIGHLLILLLLVTIADTAGICITKAMNRPLAPPAIPFDTLVTGLHLSVVKD